jgi:hypothetical protein
MKKLLMVALMMFALSLIFGCTAKESEDATKEPAGTQEAESMDTTSMDTAMMTDTAAVEDTTM